MRFPGPGPAPLGLFCHVDLYVDSPLALTVCLEDLVEDQCTKVCRAIASLLVKGVVTNLMKFGLFP